MCKNTSWGYLLLSKQIKRDGEERYEDRMWLILLLTYFLIF